MQRRGAPLRMIAPGRVFRRDTPDPTHNPMFFQVEIPIPSVVLPGNLAWTQKLLDGSNED